MRSICFLSKDNQFLGGMQWFHLKNMEQSLLAVYPFKIYVNIAFSDQGMTVA